jgi:hypothetical protein
MAALTARRAVKTKKFTTIELPGTIQQVYQGGVACFDTSTGLVAKAAASTTMIPIGKFAESKLVASGETVLVELFRELECEWLANSVANAVDAAAVGSLVYLEDDQTVRCDPRRAGRDAPNGRRSPRRFGRLSPELNAP